MKIHIVIIALLLALFSNKIQSQSATVHISSGQTATLTASLQTAGSVTNPIYRWYTAPTGGTAITTNPILITSALTSDTIFYVSVEGDEYCESPRLPVNVLVEHSYDFMICSGEIATLTVGLETAGSITNPVYKWYTDPIGGTLLGTGHTFVSSTPITADTVFYVSVEGDEYCEGSRFKVNVIALPCADLAIKNAILLPNTSNENGTYPNPVSVLGNEEIKYTISSSNPTAANVDIIIVDTLPAYLEYAGTASSTPPVSVAESNTTAPPNPSRKVLAWRFTNIAPNAGVTASFNAKAQPGSVASQPLFINRAMVSIVRSPGDSTHIQTNGTFHQGAGVSIMTFSAGIGGEIFNATEQALDYMSTPASGIIVAPEEGYKFAGWSHRDYTSLRGAVIEAQAGIMHYDTLMVYGNVELHAEFMPVEALLKEEQEEGISEMPEEDKVWAVKDELFITTTTAGSIVRIYSTEGGLREQHTIVSVGTISRRLSRGTYIVTINNDIGQKVRIE